MCKQENSFNMTEKKDIVTELQLVIKKEQAKVAENNNKLAAANELYNKLLRQGIIKKRSNTLRSIDDYKLFRNSLGNLYKA